MKKLSLFTMFILLIGLLPVVAITITDQGSLASWGYTYADDGSIIYDDSYGGSLLSVCAEPGETASFQIHYTVTDNSCHFIAASLIIAGKGPVNVYNQPVVSEFTIYHEEVFPESGRIDFGVMLLCIIPLHDPDNPDAPLRRIAADYELTAYAPGDGTCPKTDQVTICHVPPGNPDAAHTLSVNYSALNAHLAHGDRYGACPTD